MGAATSPPPQQKERREHGWPDVIYVAMVIVSIAGLAHILLKA